jgi:hypothetical protein
MLLHKNIGKKMENNLDINNLIQAFSERIGQLSTDLVIKDAYIQQLNKENLELKEQLAKLNTDKKEEK